MPDLVAPLPAVAAYIGIDWADQHHDIALQATGDPTIEQSRLPHQPGALRAWLAQLTERFGDRSIAIALETSRGPLVHALLESPQVILYPVNPRSLRRFREVFSPNGAKDDAPDARLLLSLLVRHREQLTAWTPADPATRALRRLVEYRRTTVELRTKLVQQLQATLKEYFPQALTWAGTDLTSPSASQFLQRWPSLAALQRARPATIRTFYTTHHCRRAALIATRLDEIAAATPLTTDPAIIETGVAFVRVLTTQLLALGPSIAELDAQIATAFAAHPEAELFRSFPGAGAALAPRLLVSVGTDRTRFPSASDLQTCVGVAPVTVRSGQQHQVHWRWATSTFLRQSFHEFAQHSIGRSPWARAYYHQQRARGKTHQAAVRALAFKWIRILWRCWQDRTPYEEARYQRALASRGSALATTLRSAEAIAA
jgi:transposase